MRVLQCATLGGVFVGIEPCERIALSERLMQTPRDDDEGADHLVCVVRALLFGCGDFDGGAFHREAVRTALDRIESRHTSVAYNLRHRTTR